MLPLIEQHLPGSSGLDLQALLGHRPGMSIIFMSRNADVEGTVRAMKAGALEFLTKPFDPGVMLSAVAEAIERSRAALLRLAQLRELQERHASLSRREPEVMSRVIDGPNVSAADVSATPQASSKETSSPSSSYCADTIPPPYNNSPPPPGYADPPTLTSITFRMRFLHFTGRYVMHCHMLVHEDMGMMQGVTVV